MFLAMALCAFVFSDRIHSSLTTSHTSISSTPAPSSVISLTRSPMCQS